MCAQSHFYLPIYCCCCVFETQRKRKEKGLGRMGVGVPQCLSGCQRKTLGSWFFSSTRVTRAEILPQTCVINTFTHWVTSVPGSLFTLNKTLKKNYIHRKILYGFERKVSSLNYANVCMYFMSLLKITILKFELFLFFYLNYIILLDFYYLK